MLLFDTSLGIFFPFDSFIFYLCYVLLKKCFIFSCSRYCLS